MNVRPKPLNNGELSFTHIHVAIYVAYIFLFSILFFEVSNKEFTQP